MPLSKADKEDILNRLRAEYDVLTPGKAPPDTNATIALYEQSIERYNNQIECFLTKDKSNITEDDITEYKTHLQKISELEERILALQKPNWMNRSLSFAENTRMDVEQIVHDELNLNVKDQDKRYKEYRKSYSLTLEELAAIIGVNRKNIERLETPPSGAAGNIAHKVDPFYLEALSLIYYEDPYTLLGLEPALISPIRYERTTHADYIMNTLTAYPQDQMERALHIFGKIAMLTKSQFDVLCQIVAPLPVFKRLKDCPVDLGHVERFVQHPMPFEFPKSRQDSPAYKRSVLINSVSYEIHALNTKSHCKLRKLVSWVSGGERILEILHALLFIGDFPDRKDSARPSASDEEYNYGSAHYVASLRREAVKEPQKSEDPSVK